MRKAKTRFSKDVEKHLNAIRDFEKPDDRLEAMEQIEEARMLVVYSTNSWIHWLTNMKRMSSLSEGQLERIRTFWIETAIKMASFDIEITDEVESTTVKSTEGKTKPEQGMYV